MAYMQSPGIQIKEYDISSYVPGVSSSIAGIGGVFSWGPVEDRTLISDEVTLSQIFGRPNDNNYETFLIAANFLAYSDQLYVSRAADANTYNAYTGTSVPNTQIKNSRDYLAKQDSLSANANFFAKYPSALGNSLRVSVCASAEAFSSVLEIEEESANSSLTVTYTPNAKTVRLVATDADSNAASLSLNSLANKIIAGEYLTVKTPSSTVQYLQVAGKGAVTATSNTSAAVDITLVNRYTLVEEVIDTKITRNWQYFNLFDRAPGTSTFAEERGGEGDELHIVVIDRDGGFTGLPNQVLGVYNSVSRATDARTESGTTNYYKDVINTSSDYLWVGADLAGVVSGTANAITPITVAAFYADLTGGTSGPSESAVSLAALATAYDQFKSKEDVDLSLIIAGKARGGIHGEGLANYIIDNIASIRKDCVVTISPELADVVLANNEEVDNLIEFRRALRYDGRGFITSAYKLQFDRYNNKNRWVAGCGDDAGLMARTDFERDPWWSPAGENRGIYKNLIRLAFNPNQAQRNALYKEDINSVINKAGAGAILFGDKTNLGKPSAFDRVNVRRLFDTIEKAIEKYASSLLFEFNDEYTRARFRNTVEPYLRDVMARRGITRFRVVCDETNNKPVVVDRNEFIGSIYIVPAKSINFITLNFVAVANAVSFDYAIGEVDGVSV
jgi:hypothetical protein